MKRAILFAAVFVLAAFPASAMPGGDARFNTADADKDGFLSRAEFKAAFSTLKPEAFDLIDTDKDGRIAAAEWRAFLSGHGGAGQASPHGAMPGSAAAQPNEPAAPGGLPVLTPPGK